MRMTGTRRLVTRIAVFAAIVTTPAAISSPAAASSGGIETADRGSITFAAGSTDLSDGARRELDRLAKRLRARSKDDLLVEGYAQKVPGSETGARRLSLDRALTVRNYLGDHGIRASRIEVKSRGSETTDAPDRVDLTTTSGQ